MHGNRKWVHSEGNRATYGSWVNMRLRCYNLMDADYPYYGGRGITVCARWRYNFDAFFEDMGARPQGMTLERIDNARNYDPFNCAWVSRKTQARNRRRHNQIEINGDIRSIAEWAEICKMDWNTFAARVKRGERGNYLLRPLEKKKVAA